MGSAANQFGGSGFQDVLRSFASSQGYSPYGGGQQSSYGGYRPYGGMQSSPYGNNNQYGGGYGNFGSYRGPQGWSGQSPYGFGQRNQMAQGGMNTINPTLLGGLNRAVESANSPAGQFYKSSLGPNMWENSLGASMRLPAGAVPPPPPPISPTGYKSYSSPSPTSSYQPTSSYSGTQFGGIR